MNTKKTEVIQPEGNYYDKYHSTNPIVKWMMKGFMNSIRELLEATEIRFQQVCETGCGEGEITSFKRNCIQKQRLMHLIYQGR